MQHHGKPQREQSHQGRKCCYHHACKRQHHILNDDCLRLVRHTHEQRQVASTTAIEHHHICHCSHEIAHTVRNCNPHMCSRQSWCIINAIAHHQQAERRVPRCRFVKTAVKCLTPGTLCACQLPRNEPELVFWAHVGNESFDAKRCSHLLGNTGAVASEHRHMERRHAAAAGAKHCDSSRCALCDTVFKAQRDKHQRLRTRISAARNDCHE
mmetsp:Transcript_3628/g.10197  ORF Transcript_3628/g.10197 Transcript_3628/m.10197 type:complete len:211 (-) Transcript_3628:423-1055(-)